MQPDFDGTWRNPQNLGCFGDIEIIHVSQLDDVSVDGWKVQDGTTKILAELFAFESFQGDFSPVCE